MSELVAVVVCQIVIAIVKIHEVYNILNGLVLFVSFTFLGYYLAFRIAGAFQTTYICFRLVLVKGQI